jgi:hypothetical protein
MRKLNYQQIVEECGWWKITPPTIDEVNEARNRKGNVSIQIMGVWDPITEELHPWRVCSDYR